MQLELLNLGEYHDERQEKGKKAPPSVMEKGEGMEALLGSVSAYACGTQAMFIIPVVLLFVILFPKETQIAKLYGIADREMPYYLVFSVLAILPQMVVDVFLLNLLEVLWGYKVYDYFTFVEYRFRTRETKWLSGGSFARSIAHAWRSMDNLAFSQQYYYVTTLMAWGVLFLCLGMTVLIRN